MQKFVQTLLFFLIICLLPACAPKMPPLDEVSDPRVLPQQVEDYLLGEVSDLRVLPQRVEYYIQGLSGATRLLSDDQRQSLAAHFLERRFAPWDADFGVQTDNGDPFWGLKQYQSRPLYGENLLPLPPGWLEEMSRQSAVESYPSRMQAAVAVVTTALRVLPTHKPMFNDPTSAGQGFPFDMLQNSLVPAGTPVLVVHASQNGSWYLVRTPHVSGWVRPWEVAWADQAFMDVYRSADLFGFTRDEVPAHTSSGAFVLLGRVGMLLPRSPIPPPPGMIALLTPLRRADGWAELESILVPDDYVVPWPMAATPDNFSRVLNGLLGRPYGWGGLFENRDCSALIQDLYALFGLAMPRNSRAQAQAGRVIELENLSAKQKEKHILEHGVPLLSIVNMPGHVMLYLGPDPISGRPIVLHSIWGLRVQLPKHGSPPTSTPGRWILGRTVITTLTPGKELPSLIRPQGLLVERIFSLTILGE